MTEEFQKPKPRVRAITVHELRRVMTARHKMLIASGTEEEAIALIRDTYGADDDSCKAMYAWLKCETIPGPEPRQVSKEAMERIHVATDPKTGDDRYVDTVPGSIPPRPRPKR